MIRHKHLILAIALTAFAPLHASAQLMTERTDAAPVASSPGDPNKSITLTLPFAEVELLVNAAGSSKMHSWLEINPLIQKIIAQARQQQMIPKDDK